MASQSIDEVLKYECGQKLIYSEKELPKNFWWKERLCCYKF